MPPCVMTVLRKTKYSQKSNLYHMNMEQAPAVQTLHLFPLKPNPIWSMFISFSIKKASYSFLHVTPSGLPTPNSIKYIFVFLKNHISQETVDGQ